MLDRDLQSREKEKLTIKLYENKNECCGCGACCAICPRDAIMMKSDDEGFLYPIIDNGKCVKCNYCLTVCAWKVK